MFTKAAHIKPTISKAHHPAFGKQQQNNAFIPNVQAKLKVDNPNSTHEKEADQMADHVVNASSFFHANPAGASQGSIQRAVGAKNGGLAGADPDKYVDEILNPMGGNTSDVKSDEMPKKNPSETKPEKAAPSTPDKTVKKAPSPSGGNKKQGAKGAAAAEQEEVPAANAGPEVSAEDAAAFQGEANLTPKAPIAITPELSASPVLQTKPMDNNGASEEIGMKEEEQNGEGVQSKSLLQLASDDEAQGNIQRSGNGAPVVTSQVESGIASSKSGGQSMDLGTQEFMGSQFQSDFSNVKIHNDSQSAQLNNQLQARAFTHENHIYFNEGQYDPGSKSGQSILAHELTHVVQQDSSIQRKPQISQAPKSTVQRLGIGDALDYFADKANHIPGFRMFTIILGINPINMSSVDRSAGNILRAMVEFLPGGKLITDALDNHGVFDKVSTWFKEQMDTLSITGSSIRAAIDKFLDSLGWSDIFDLGGVFKRGIKIITAPIKQVINFAIGLVDPIIEMVKEAILRPLVILAEGTPAYDLLRVVLGEDPITKDPYPPTAENLIGGFMKLIGQEEVWENIKKGNAIDKAYAWFQGALGGLMEFVTAIPSTIIETITSLTWQDIVLIPKAFVKVGKAFVNVATKFYAWAGGTVLALLEIIFTVVAPAAVPWIKKAGAGFNSILENPVGFIGNLVKAAKNGFMKFAANIAKHLKKSMINWLMGSLAGAGIYIPAGLDFKEIMKFVLSVLGISWANIRIKLVKHLGETAVKALETGFELITILVEKGPIAMWERIMEHLSDLKNMVIGEISSWVITKVVTKAITKLVSSLNPAGAVIQAILFIYDTITFLIDKIRQIAQVGFAVLDSIASIANGVIQAAVKKVESTLSNILTLAISFLANFLGLGKISKKIVEIVKKIKEKVDAALDKVIGWIVAQAKKFLQKIISVGVPKDPKERLRIGMDMALKAVNKLSGKVTKKMIDPILKGIKARYEFQSLTTYESAGKWRIKGKVNPGDDQESKANANPDHTKEAIKFKEEWLDEEVMSTEGVLDGAFKSQAIDAKYTFFNSDGKPQLRRKDAKTAPKLSIVERKVVEGKASLPTHKNYIPDKIILTESGGMYKASYTTKNSDGTETARFTVDISFDQVVEGIPNKVQVRSVEGKGLTSKAQGVGRGGWDSGTGGFDNAHIIGDQFGGSGKNFAMNIHPSSPEYNRSQMASIENSMASNFKQQDQKYNLRATASLSDDQENPSMLKSFLNTEFSKDNTGGGDIPNEIKSDAKNKLIQHLQSNISADVFSLPAKFMSITYHSESLTDDMNHEKFDKKTKSLSLGEDKSFDALAEKYKQEKANSGTQTIPQ